jgi:hypothetical protein
VKLVTFLNSYEAPVKQLAKFGYVTVSRTGESRVTGASYMYEKLRGGGGMFVIVSLIIFNMCMYVCFL